MWLAGHYYWLTSYAIHVEEEKNTPIDGGRYSISPLYGHQDCRKVEYCKAQKVRLVPITIYPRAEKRERQEGGTQGTQEVLHTSREYPDYTSWLSMRICTFLRIFPNRIEIFPKCILKNIQRFPLNRLFHKINQVKRWVLCSLVKRVTSNKRLVRLKANIIVIINTHQTKYVICLTNPPWNP